MWTLFLEARKNDLFSKETLDLTTKLILYTPDNYNVWNFRKKIIEKTENFFPEEEKIEFYEKELEWDRKLLERNHKSYCCWHHRRWITKKMTMNWESELNLCTFALSVDQRNFHCWNYRRFVVVEGKMPLLEEMNFSMKKIEENFSNYSAWHHRSFIIPLLYSGDELVSVIENDFEVVKNAFYTEPDDQSAWFYHNWLMMIVKKFSPSKFESRSDTEINMCKELLSIEPNAKWPKIILLQIEKGCGKIKEEDIPLLEQVKTTDTLHTSFYNEYF